jgi:deoxyribonuclease IV
MNLGAHISIAGGLHLIFERAAQVTANSIQIFVTNQNQWTTREPKPEELELYFQERERFKPYQIVTHSRYLINLCSNNPVTEEKSLSAFYDEIRLCETYDIPYLVIHPGSHMGAGEEAGLNKIIANLDKTLDRFDALKTVILMETTAGQGTNLGYRFEHLKYLIDNSRYRDHIAVCFDTCHVFAAGYDLKNSYEDVMRQFDEIIDTSLIKAFHLNDSKKEFGSKKDRHAHIGEGELGSGPFAKLMNDSRFSQVPMILETPKGENDDMDIVNLNRLRDMRQGEGK